MSNILVCGGAGFIGSHLCKKLIAENNNIICMDNLYTGSLKNVEDLLDHSNFRFIEHDISTSVDLELPVEQIYNLACPASPVHYQQNPVKTLETNVLGTLNLLNFAKDKNATFLQASTSEVYGNPSVHPQTEEYFGNVNPIGIRSCYDEGKRCAETLCFDFHRQYGLNIKVVRIFNTYGPNMQINDGRVVSNFIIQALRGEPITVYGQGVQTRSFCYVEDLVNGLIKMMSTSKEITGPVNLGNPDEFTILELAEYTLKEICSTSQIVFNELPSDDPERRKPNIDKAQAYLGWKPRISLSEGLKKTIKYFVELGV